MGSECSWDIVIMIWMELRRHLDEGETMILEPVFRWDSTWMEIRHKSNKLDGLGVMPGWNWHEVFRTGWEVIQVAGSTNIILGHYRWNMDGGDMDRGEMRIYRPGFVWWCKDGGETKKSGPRCCSGRTWIDVKCILKPGLVWDVTWWSRDAIFVNWMELRRHLDEDGTQM